MIDTTSLGVVLDRLGGITPPSDDPAEQLSNGSISCA